MLGLVQWFIRLPFRFLFSVFRFLSPPRVVRAGNGHEAAGMYIDHLERHFGTTHVPLAATSYKTALEKAKRDLRFLVVILTSEVHDDTPRMQQLLCHDTFRDYALDNDLLIWAGNVADREAYSVGNSLGATRFPFLGIMVYNTIEDPEVSCVATILGVPQIIDLITILEETIGIYGPTLVSLKADRNEQTFSRVIRAEQDSAYEASLRKDREIAEAERRIQQEKRQREEGEAMHKENLRLWRRWNYAHLEAEPTGQGKHITHLNVRLPDGSRSVRKFRSDASIETLYKWADCQLHRNDFDKEDMSDVRPSPEHYKHTYDFTLAIPMPRKILELTEKTTVAEHKDLFPSASLMVERTESEESSA